MLLFHDQSYGIHYEYTVSLNTSQEGGGEEKKEPEYLYIWTHSSWQDCTVQCGGGNAHTPRVSNGCVDAFWMFILLVCEWSAQVCFIRPGEEETLLTGSNSSYYNANKEKKFKNVHLNQTNDHIHRLCVFVCVCAWKLAPSHRLFEIPRWGLTHWFLFHYYQTVFCWNRQIGFPGKSGVC